MKPMDQSCQSCEVMGKSKAAKVAAFVVHALAMQGSHGCMAAIVASTFEVFFPDIALLYAMQCNVMQCIVMQCIVMQCNKMQCNAM